MATPAELDEIVNQHFMFEATDDVDGVMGSLADEAEHQAVPTIVGTLTDKDEMRAFYTQLFGEVKGEGVTPVRRLYGDDFVIDETMWHGRVEDGRLFGLPGKSGQVSFRMLHVFEVTGTKIAREQVWCDVTAIRDQIG